MHLPTGNSSNQTLKQWLAKPDILGKKQIIFTQYADTAQYLHNQITDGNDPSEKRYPQLFLLDRDIERLLALTIRQISEYTDNSSQ